MPNGAATRISHWKAVFGLGWAILCILWSVVSVADTLVGKYGPPRIKDAWEQSWHPKWDWKTWIIGLLLLTVVTILEGSYRERRKNKEQTDLRESELQRKLNEERARNSRPDVKGKIEEVHINGDWGNVPVDCECFVIIRAYLVNHSPTRTNIKEYRLSVTTAHHVSSQQIKTDYWQLGRKEIHRRNFATGEKIVRDDLLDLTMRIGTLPFERGDGQDGWLAFCLETGEADIPEVTSVELIVVDAFGGEHIISGSGPWEKSGILVEREL